jgi:hypothetical protein
MNEIGLITRSSYERDMNPLPPAPICYENTVDAPPFEAVWDFGCVLPLREKQIPVPVLQGEALIFLSQRLFPMALLPDLPDAARVWIHPATVPLSEDTQAALLDRLGTFVDAWTSHQQAVRGGVTVLHDRFVVLAGARLDGADPSGCAIDDATHAVSEAADALGIEWVPSLHVLYRTDDGDIAAVSRSTFQDRVDAGAVTTATPVFDPSLTTLGAVRDGAFEQPAGQSWHANAFSLPEPA